MEREGVAEEITLKPEGKEGVKYVDIGEKCIPGRWKSKEQMPWLLSWPGKHKGIVIRIAGEEQDGGRGADFFFFFSFTVVFSYLQFQLPTDNCDPETDDLPSDNVSE